MQRIRKYASAALIVALVALNSSAIAAPRDQDGPRTPETRQKEQPQKAQKPPKGIIAVILEYVENQLSLPPG